MNNLFFTIENSKMVCYAVINEKFIYFENTNEIPVESKIVKIFDFLHYREALEVLFAHNKEPFICISRVDDNSFDFLHISFKEFELLKNFFKGQK